MKSLEKIEIRRPLANFHPNLWGDRFLDYTPPDQEEEEVKELEEMVRKELVAIEKDPKERLEYVDAIIRLGVAYHFEKEIEDNLQEFHNNLHYINNCYEGDLNYVSLRFRLLRQHGFYVSSDVFEKFKCKKGNLKECLASDVQGLLSLYEAAYYRVHGESALDEAVTFATTCLASLTETLSSPIAEQIAHSLKLPLQKRSIRLESKYQIGFYESKPNHDKTLLRFAKLDFNRLQLLHKMELRDFIRWSRWFDMSINLPNFARDRAVETYFWSLGAYHEPNYAYARMCLNKLLKIISIIDDMYDSYGAIEELFIFTKAILRWDESCKDELPQYMRLFYQAILDTFEDIKRDLAKEERSYAIHYLREQMKATCQGYLQEAQWCHDQFVPTYDDYLKNGVLGGLGEIANEDAFEWIDQNSKAPRASCIITRLLNDISSHKFEKKRDHVASAVECYMEEFRTTEEETYNEILLHIEGAWKKINEDMLRPTVVSSAPLLTVLVNLTRVLYDIYQIDEDGYTMTKYLQPKVIAVLVDPVVIV